MKNIRKFDITRLRTEEDFGFQKRIEAETALLTAETDKPMVAAYQAALTAFDEALKGSTTNPQSIAVTRADELADKAWSGLNSQTKSMLGHPIEALRTVAAEASALISKYGNPTAMPYNEEYGRLHNLLQDLAAFGIEKQKKIYIDAWVTEIQTRYDEFMSATAARDAEAALHITGIVKQTRTDADAAFRTLVERVNALALINGDTDYAPFIDHVNVIIDQAEATLAGRSTRAEKKRNGGDKPVV